MAKLRIISSYSSNSALCTGAWVIAAAQLIQVVEAGMARMKCCYLSVTDCNIYLTQQPVVRLDPSEMHLHGTDETPLRFALSYLDDLIHMHLYLPNEADQLFNFLLVEM